MTNLRPKKPITSAPIAVVRLISNPNKGNGLGVNPIPVVKKKIEEIAEAVLYAIGLTYMYICSFQGYLGMK